MSKHIHFELFVRRGAARSWSLHDAIESRQDALDAAKAQMASGFVTAVRVVKEVFDDATNEFRSVVILEDGNLKKIALGREEEDKPAALPCLTPEDLYSVHARLTLSRLFADTLARWKLTVTELIHRPDMLEKLEATGTLFQHAVQKVAIAQTASNGVPVPQIKRRIWDYLKPILSAAPFEAALLDPRLPPLERLALAARLQTRILRSSLAEASRGEGASAIDAIARHTIDQFRTQLTAADRTRSAVVALTFARALESGGVPKGTCETAIREVLRKLAA